MKTLLLAASSFAATAAFALGPRIDPATVSLTQDRARLVTVKYTLENCPGIVTLDFQTNRLNAATTDEADWVSIGGENVQGVEGDVNRLVTELGEHTLTWQPRELWPDHKTKTGAFRAVVTVWATNAPPDYLVVDLKASSNLTYYADASFIPRGGITNDYYKQDAIVMRLIKAKGRSWMMGSPDGSYNHQEDEPYHQVILTNDYYMGIYMLTRGQFGQFAKYVSNGGSYYYEIDGKKVYNYPSGYGATMEPWQSCPVRGATYDVMRGTSAEFNWPKDRHKVSAARWLGKARVFTGVDFDLATEAQWEFACRAGTATVVYSGDFYALTHDTYLRPIAWYNSNRDVDGVSYAWFPVGLKLPNAFGLYDTIGNGKEAVLDWYAEDYGGTANPFEPEGPALDTGSRVYRAMYALYDYPVHRAAYRATEGRNYEGTRLVCPVTLTYPASEK